MNRRAEAGVAAAARCSPRPALGYSNDGVLNLMVVKDAMECTWFYNPDLGAPNKQLLYDYPVLRPADASGLADDDGDVRAHEVARTHAVERTDDLDPEVP
jgi:hypothetical protein